MSISSILTIILIVVIVLIIFIVLIAAVQWNSRYIDELDKKLSALLDNPTVSRSRRINLISGNYQNYSINLEWSPPQSNNQPCVLLYAKIYDLTIPALEANFRTESQANNSELWKQLSDIRSVRAINFSNHTLEIEMRWFTALVDEKTGTLLAGTLADAWNNINTDHIVNDVENTLNKILKILEK